MGPLVLLGLAILGALAVLLVTRHGIGLSTDSVAYVDGARSMARGDGFTSGFSGRIGPITHWPPLYSAVLAGPGLLGVDPLGGARVLASLLFGANVFVAGWLVRRHASTALLPATATSVLVLVSADLLEVHSWAWSEPLFLLLSALGLHHLVVYLEHPHSRRRLFAAAALVGLAALTRYVGVTLIIAGGLAILWLGSGRWLRRGADAVIFGLLSMAPLAFWMLRNFLLTGNGSSRDLVVNPIGMSHLVTAAKAASVWLVPPIVPGSTRTRLLVAAVAAAAIGIVVGRRVFREEPRSRGGRLLRTVLCFVAVYTGFVALTISLFDAAVAFDPRMLAPLHFLLLVAAGVVVAGAPRTPGWMWAGLGALVLLQAAHTAAWARTAQGGLGYSGRALRESELWSEIEQLPERTPLYSNAYDVVYVYTGRAIRPLPTRPDPDTLAADDEYGRRLASLSEELARDSGVVVYLPIGSWRKYMPTEAELDRAFHGADRRRFPDGTLYRMSPGSRRRGRPVDRVYGEEPPARPAAAGAASRSSTSRNGTLRGGPPPASARSAPSQYR